MGILEDLVAELPLRAKELRKTEQERTGSTRISDSMENVLRGMGLGHLLEVDDAVEQQAEDELKELRSVIRGHFNPRLPEDFTPGELKEALVAKYERGVMQWAEERQKHEQEKDELTRLIVVYAIPALNELFMALSDLRGGTLHQDAIHKSLTLRHGLKEATGLDVDDPQAREAFIKKISS